MNQVRIMELSTVISTFKQLDAEKFYCSFTRLFELSFRIDDLMFWCEVTGINEKALGVLCKHMDGSY